MVHLGVDLSLVKYAHVDPVRRQAILRLPKPHLIMGKVDHERSEELWLKAVAWFPVSSQQLVRAEVWKAADKKVEVLGQDEKYMKEAKTQAELVLKQLFDGVKWTVQFEWEDVNAKAKDGLSSHESHDQRNHRLSSEPRSGSGHSG